MLNGHVHDDRSGVKHCTDKCKQKLSSSWRLTWRLFIGREGTTIQFHISNARRTHLTSTLLHHEWHHSLLYSSNLCYISSPLYSTGSLWESTSRYVNRRSSEVFSDVLVGASLGSLSMCCTTHFPIAQLQ